MSATSGQPLPRAQVLFDGDRAKRKPELVPRLGTDAVAELVQRLVVSMTTTAAVAPGETMAPEEVVERAVTIAELTFSTASRSRPITNGRTISARWVSSKGEARRPARSHTSKFLSFVNLAFRGPVGVSMPMTIPSAKFSGRSKLSVISVGFAMGPAPVINGIPGSMA